MRFKHSVRYTSLAFAVVLAVVPAALAALTKGRIAAPFTPQLKPGDYVWHPEVSPAGPVVIIVSLPDQVMYVYRNGVRIGRSTVSTGKPGKRTPTGEFTVLQKKVSHESNIYKGAKMPHMQRLTWSWDRHACWTIAGLSGVRRLCADAGGLCQKTLFSHEYRHDRYYRRQQFCAVSQHAAGNAVLR